jgi:hypothetical protein
MQNSPLGITTRAMALFLMPSEPLGVRFQIQTPTSINRTITYVNIPRSQQGLSTEGHARTIHHVHFNNFKYFPKIKQLKGRSMSSKMFVKSNHIRGDKTTRDNRTKKEQP